MMYYRRGEHRKKKDVLTVDNVLCKTSESHIHVMVDGKHLCFHDMKISFPDWSPDFIDVEQL